MRSTPRCNRSAVSHEVGRLGALQHIVKPPEFLKVQPADVGRVGGLGACILALVRYMTALQGEANGRRVVDGETWWRASYDGIAQMLGGAPPRTVGSTVSRLLETGDLMAIPVQDFYGDRAKAYRASDQPSAETDTGSDQPSADMADRIGRNGRAAQPNRPSSSADIADLPLVGELEEHSVGEKARKRGTRLDPDWEPPRDVIQEMRAQCPGVDLRAEHRKFIDYWTDQTGAKATKRSWIGTWRNWIRRAAETNRPHGTRNGASTADQRVTQIQALKHQPSRLEIL